MIISPVQVPELPVLLREPQEPRELPVPPDQPVPVLPELREPQELQLPVLPVLLLSCSRSPPRTKKLTKAH
ncbi:MAG: hypothetical protein K4445_04100 [Deltaproteobacteria bacterium]|jgi:hypothetical protein|nr:hypothetical protein [Syntrophaceae bacterium]